MQRTSPFWREIGRPGVVVGLSLLAVYWFSVSWNAGAPRDFANYVIGRDFLNFWIYGREAWHPSGAARYYDIELYNQHLLALFPWQYPTQIWSYPPQIFLFAAPFGLLPYGAAFLLWTLLGVAAFCFAVRGDVRGWRDDAALLFAPAATICFLSGQNSFLTAAALITVFHWLDKKPRSAGILLGLLTVKPQLGLLFPLMLLLTRRWKVFFAASVTALLLAAMTTAIYGTAIWSAYFGIGLAMQKGVLLAPSELVQGLMPTVFMNARVAGFSAEVAYAVHAAAALVAVVAVIWVYIRPRDPTLSYCALLVGNLMVTPYLMSYDLVVMGWVVMVLYRMTPAPLERRSLLALFWLPVIALALAKLGVPGAALVFAVAGGILLHRLGWKAAMDDPDGHGLSPPRP